MTSLNEFKEVLDELVSKVPEVENELRYLSPGKVGHSKAEEQTKNRLIVPFLDALGFDAEHRTPEASMRRAGIGQLVWVDYTLKKEPADRKGLALLEAKSVLEEDIWKKHKKQIRDYLHDYQLSLRTEDPVRWIILTNFRELYILNIADYEPFFKLTYRDYVENAALLFRLLHREQLSNNQITSVYYEKRHVPLGQSFLNDLKLWRLLLANGLRQSQPALTLEQIKVLSQQMLNRIIFIRVLETYGIHPYLSEHFVIADSLDVAFDINAWLGTEPQRRIILGNPPWGAELAAQQVSLKSFQLAKGQFDSYDLFIERVTGILRPGDIFGYVVPDSMLQLPQHMPLRHHILRHYQIDSLMKLGEGVFEDVFRAALAFIFTRSDAINPGHTLRGRIIVKAEREQLIRSSRDNILQTLLDNDSISITQTRFMKNKEYVFDIFASDEDVDITQSIDQDAMDWKEVITTGRGVELSKNGLVKAG